MSTAIRKPASLRSPAGPSPLLAAAPRARPLPRVAREPEPGWPAPAKEGAAPGLGAVEFMGGRQQFKALPQSRAEIHAALVQGLPSALLLHLIDHLSALSLDEVADTLGISGRTLRRLRDQPAKPMPADLASKTWLIAETLAQASMVFGGRGAAERWITRPAMGLDGARPIDLMRTLQGAELVTEFLGRLDHGVYN